MLQLCSKSFREKEEREKGKEISLKMHGRYNQSILWLMWVVDYYLVAPSSKSTNQNALKWIRLAFQFSFDFFILHLYLQLEALLAFSYNWSGSLYL